MVLRLVWVFAFMHAPGLYLPMDATHRSRSDTIRPKTCGRCGRPKCARRRRRSFEPKRAACAKWVPKENDKLGAKYNEPESAHTVWPIYTDDVCSNWPTFHTSTPSVYTKSCFSMLIESSGSTSTSAGSTASRSPGGRDAPKSARSTALPCTRPRHRVGGTSTNRNPTHFRGLGTTTDPDPGRVACLQPGEPRPQTIVRSQPERHLLPTPPCCGAGARALRSWWICGQGLQETTRARGGAGQQTAPAAGSWPAEARAHPAARRSPGRGWPSCSAS
jgi:hypothetical protein